MPAIKIDIKPLSVNEAYKGKRYKTNDYKRYEIAVLSLLPKKYDLPEPPYEIRFTFGFSSHASDWDNCIKATQDIISKKYKFNDKLIKRGVVEVDNVPKGSEYFTFEILSLNKT
jgi:hypothetical protein